MSFPLGALCIKTAINSEKNLPKAVVFEHVLSDNPFDCAKQTADRCPYAVGMSVYIWNSKWFEIFACELRRLLPEVILFAGGPQMSSAASMYPEYLDFITLGEGELNTVRALKNNEKGIIDAVVPDLEKLDSPFLSGSADAQMKGTDSVLWELTRGCPFACAFCFESRGKNIVRDYPFERIEQELQYLIDHEIESVFVLDPTFNLNIDRAKKIMNLLLAKAPSYMHFTFEIRAELIDEELARMFADLNCSLQIGLQSSDEKILSTIGRKFNRQIFTEKVKLLSSNGVAFGLDVIIGLPGDSLETFRKTIDYAVSLMPSNLDVFVLSLLPGTELASRKDELGLVSSEDRDYTLKCSPTFSEQDLAQALKIRDSLDLFYTKGQACMWIHCLLETLNITSCNLFSLFAKWMSQTGRSPDEDVWVLQDDFVTSLFEKTQNNKLIDAMKSFMELHQGLCYVTDTCEDAVLDLKYHPDDLARLDRMGLSEFVKTYRPKKCQICLSWDDQEGVVWNRVN